MYGPRTPQRGSDGPLALRHGWMREITSMKKLLLSFLMVFLALPALADEATLTFSEKYSANTVLDKVTVDIDPVVTATFAKANGSTNPQYYTKGSAVRLYAKNTVTIAVSDEYKIESIVYTMGSDQFQSGSSSDCGTFDFTSSANEASWTAPATNTTSVTFTNGGTSGNSRLAAVKVVYSRTVAETKVSTPEILLDNEVFTEGAELYKGLISIRTVTVGASTSYSTDESAVWTEYTDAIDVAALALGEHAIWAKATKEGLEDSEVAKVSFTVVEKPQAPTYRLVTSADEVKAGKKYLIAAYTSSCVLGDFVDPSKKQARQAIEVTIDNDLITEILPETVSVVTLTNSTAVEGAFDMKVNDGYLYASGNSGAGSNQNYLGVEDTPNDLSAATITIDDTNKVSITFSKATGKAGKYVYFNSMTNPKRFTAYVAKHEDENGYEGMRLFVEVPAAPVAPVAPVIKLDGEDVADDTVPVKGEEISFGPVDEGVTIYYNITADNIEKAPAKAGEEAENPTTVEKDDLTYTLYDGTPIAIGDGSWKLSYFARANGVDSEVKTLTVSKPTGIEGIADEAGAAEWFNLQGVRVSEPQQGIYVRVANGKAAKVVVE